MEKCWSIMKYFGNAADMQNLEKVMMEKCLKNKGNR
jgi:hypothetical protein